MSFLKVTVALLPLASLLGWLRHRLIGLQPTSLLLLIRLVALRALVMIELWQRGAAAAVEGDRLRLAGKAFPVMLLAQLTSVTIPFALLGWRAAASLRNVPPLNRVGMAGGTPVVRAVAMPDGSPNLDLLVATYGVVLFSIVQGSTLGTLDADARLARS